MAKIEIRFSGLGGQGVLLAGVILGTAVTQYEGRYAAQTQSYGAETRGGPARSDVIVSDEKIHYPLLSRCDILVSMNQSTMKNDEKDLREASTLIVDEDLVEEIPSTKNLRVFKVPATRSSQEAFKSKTFANMVMLGAVSKITSIAGSEALKSAISSLVPKETLQANLAAFDLGVRLGADRLEKG